MQVDVFIDRACALAADPRIRRLGAIPFEATDSTALKRLADGGIVLIGTRTSDGAPVLPTIRVLRADHPHVVVILCVEWREARRVPLSQWFRAGVDELVTFGDPADVVELARVVERHGMAPPPAVELKLLRSTRPSSWVLEAVLYVLRNECSGIEASELARRFGYSERAFRDFLLNGGYPRLRDIRRLGQFLRMAELIGRGINAPSELAQRLGFLSPTDMRKAKSRLRQSMAQRGCTTLLAQFSSGLTRLHSLLVPRTDE